MSWKIKKHLKDILEQESGYSIFPAGIRTKIALCYPNHYNVGMSNLGMHIIYEQINKRPDSAAERFFLPKQQLMKEYKNSRTPLLSLESQKPLYEFKIVAFAISFELDYFNVLSMLELGKVKLLSNERDDSDPLVIAGGPCSTFNPEPLADFIDSFIVGEGEETINALLDAYHKAKQENLSRAQLLFNLAQIPGIYVPRFYTPSYHADGTIEKITVAEGIPETIKRQWVKDLDAYPAHTVINSEHTEFNFYLIETARGCGRHCRFCMAGYCFRKPRNRSLATIKAQIEKVPPHKKIGLMGAAISDHPDIDAICHFIRDNEHPMSVASFRADSVTQTLVNSLAASGQRTLTLAPEAGSKKIRKIINKGIEEEHLYQSIDMGIKAGVRNYRLYIMVGLPDETAEDIEAIIDMANNLRQYMDEKGAHGKLTLSINPFVPKPFTPFQWLPMADMKETAAFLRHIKESLKANKRIECLIEVPRDSYLQGILSRGDRRLGKILYASFLAGGSKKFRQKMKEMNLKEDFYLYRQRDFDEILPWDKLDMGVKKAYFIHELEMAKMLKNTPRCFDGCKRCGVC